MKIINWIDRNIHGKLSAIVLFSMFIICLLLFAYVLDAGITLTNYDYVTIEREVHDTEEIVVLEVAEKTRRRLPTAFNRFLEFFSPYEYMLTFKSDDEAYNGKSISVGEEIFEKYEIGKSYEFRVKTTTTREKKAERNPIRSPNQCPNFIPITKASTLTTEPFTLARAASVYPHSIRMDIHWFFNAKPSQ